MWQFFIHTIVTLLKYQSRIFHMQSYNLKIFRLKQQLCGMQLVFRRGNALLKPIICYVTFKKALVYPILLRSYTLIVFKILKTMY
jgi:hypothetical protein